MNHEQETAATIGDMIRQACERYLREIFNLAIEDGLLTEEQARAILPLVDDMSRDGKDGPL